MEKCYDLNLNLFRAVRSSDVSTWLDKFVITFGSSVMLVMLRSSKPKSFNLIDVLSLLQRILTAGNFFHKTLNSYPC